MIQEHDTGISRRSFLKVAALTGVGLAGSTATAFAKDRSAPALADMSGRYRVDPAWPKRPADAKWGEMPGVAVDAKDQVWIFTRARPPVQVYRRDGQLVRSWGQGVIKTAHYIRIGPKGNVWVADTGKHVVMQLTSEGKLLKTLGTPGKPGCDARHLNQPTDMAVTPAGEVFVSDGYGNDRVVHFDANGKFVKAWGKRGDAPGQFDLPHAIVVDSKGKLYVADRNNGRVQVFDRSGKFLGQWKDMVPWGLWISKTDEMWACGSSPMPKKGRWRGLPPKDQILMKYDTSGKVSEALSVAMMAAGKWKPGQVSWLHAVALDSKGNIYLGGIKDRRAQKYIKRAR